jgi:hypothetical protein
VEGQTCGLTEGSLDDRLYQRVLQQAAGTGPPLLVTPLALMGRGSVPGTREGKEDGQRHRLWGDWSGRVARIRGWLRRRSLLQWIAAGAVLALLLAGLRLFAGPHGWRQGVLVALALLKGEYVDPVSGYLTEERSIGQASGWLIGGTLFYALVGTLLTSALVAVILEWLLRDRLGVRRPRPPRRDWPVALLVEGGVLAERVQRDLEREPCSVLRVSEQDAGAAAVLRLEEALALQQRWPQARLAVLAASMGASEHLGDLLGGMTVISTTDLVADAIVATALGEVVLGVCRVRGGTLLLVRYRISAGDTLCGRTDSWAWPRSTSIPWPAPLPSRTRGGRPPAMTVTRTRAV